MVKKIELPPFLITCRKEFMSVMREIFGGTGNTDLTWLFWHDFEVGPAGIYLYKAFVHKAQ